MKRNDFSYKKIDDISEIKVVDKVLRDYYEYHEVYIDNQQKTHNNVVVRTYYYNNSGVKDAIIYPREAFLTEKDANDNPIYIIEKEKVYFCPFIEIIFNSTSKNMGIYKKSFNSFEEACTWADNFIIGNNMTSKLIKFN